MKRLFNLFLKLSLPGGKKGDSCNKKLLLVGVLVMLVFLQLNAQNVLQIHGSVKDATGQSLVGANIIVKGSTENAVSDSDGNFTIRTMEGNKLIISYLGYLTKEIPVKNQKTLQVVLEDDSQLLDEVVAIGYGSVGKKEITSAVSHISSKDFLSIHAANPAEQLQGKVAGLSITNQAPADPNSSTSIQIRGASSRAAGLGPLIVIDGVMGGNLYNVNQNDIESIDVLKDGAASAIYGTRGSNGVIIVTTKKAKTDGIANASYSGYVAFDMINDQLDVLSKDEFLANKRGQDYGAETDWFKEITRTGFVHNHSLTVSGGNALNNYRATLDYKNAQGIDLRSGREEIGGRASINHQAKSGLYKVTFNIAPRTIQVDNASYGAYQQAILLNPTQPVKNPNDPTGKTYFRTVGYGAYNPVEELKTDLSGKEVKYLDWDATLQLNLLPLLGKENCKHSLKTHVTLAQQINDNFTYYFQPSYNTVLSQSKNKQGHANREYNKSVQESLEWLVNYIYESNHHTAKFMGGYSYQYFQDSGLKAENYNFTSDALTYNDLGNGTYFQNVVTNDAGFDSWKSDSKLIAFFGRFSYDYKQRYMFTASLRYEGSSKFGANNKWGYFPAFSVGWRLSEEDFLKNVKWLSELKIRGDYGVTGNQNFGSYLSIPTMIGCGVVKYRGELYQTWASNENPNPDLRWEKGKNWNIGVDFGLFNNKLTGSLNYYNRKSQDLLGWYNVPTPPNLHKQTFLNLGTIRNNGLEIDLNLDVVQTKDFGYSIGLVGSTNNNKLVSLSNKDLKANNYVRMAFLGDPNISDYIQELREGERIGNYHTYAYAGVDEDGKWMVWNKGNTKKIHLSEAADEDKRIVGNGLPTFTASFNNTFRYKNFDLALYFRGVFGFDIYNIHDCYYGLQGVSDNVLKSAYGKNAHIKDVNTTIDYFLEKGDYVKLDVVSLGYTFRLQNKWINSLRMYATGRNLATFTGFSGVDPQSYPINGLTPGANGDRGYYPSTAQLLFGVQVDF